MNYCLLIILGQSDAGLICFIFSGRKIRGNKLMMLLFKPSVFF